MRKFTIVLLSVFHLSIVSSQGSLDVALSELATDITKKLSIKEKKKLVVLFVTDINKTQTTAGKYIADILSVNIVNSVGDFQVFDRDNLSSITEAKKLIAEGYIDVSSAQALGRLLSVEAILVGNYTVLNTSLKISVKAIDVSSGLVIAASLKDVAISGDVESLLGISTNSATSSSTSNRGFNGQPLNSNEVYNNSETVAPDCSTYKYGNYCFTNSTLKSINISLTEGTYKSLKKFDKSNNPAYYEPQSGLIEQVRLTLDVNQTQCIYELKPGPVTYKVFSEGYRVKEGEIFVEECKSKTFVIK